MSAQDEGFGIGFEFDVEGDAEASAKMKKLAGDVQGVGEVTA